MRPPPPKREVPLKKNNKEQKIENSMEFVEFGSARCTKTLSIRWS